jgi:hypothetical protein
MDLFYFLASVFGIFGVFACGADWGFGGGVLRNIVMALLCGASAIVQLAYALL